MKTRAQKQAEWREANREQLRRYAANYRRDNAEVLRAKREKAYAADPQKFKRRQKKYRPKQREYTRTRRGLPAPTRPAPNACECCAAPVKKRQLALDHDHETGRFRGWLCSGCNTGLGLLGDSLTAARAVVAYLERV